MIMKMLTKRNFVILSLLTLSSISFSFALNELWDSTNNLSLTDSLSNTKNAILSDLDTSFKRLNEKYTVANENTFNTPNYKSLVCLWLLNNVFDKEDLAQEEENLKNNILKEYVSLNSDIFNVINQYSVGLISDIVYETEVARLKSEIENFENTYDDLIDAFEETYGDKISDLESEVVAYNQENDALLKDLNNKVIKIEEILGKYDVLQDSILEFDSKYLGDENGITDSIDKTRNTLETMLDNKFRAYIDMYVNKYKNVPGLDYALNMYRKEKVSKYWEEFNKELQGIVGEWYNADDFDYVKEKVSLIRDNFYEGAELRCSKVLATSMDLDSYVNVVSSKSDEMIQNLEEWVDAIGNEDSSQYKWELVKIFDEFYSNRFDDEIDTFKKYVKEKVSELLKNPTTDTIDAENTNQTYTNPFVKVIYNMETKSSLSRDSFVKMMSAAVATLDKKIEKETSSSKKLTLQSIKAAVQIYVNENQ